MTEHELIAALQQNKSDAFGELVERYKDQIVSTCFNFVHNQADAEDLAQEVFIEVFKAIERFRGDASISTWLYRIAINKSLNFVKKHKRLRWIRNLQTAFSSDEKAQEVPDAKTADPHADLEQSERVHVLTNAIDSLAENQKIAFNLSKFEGLSYKEIAKVMGTSVPAVESLLNRAKKALQNKLHSYYKNQI